MQKVQELLISKEKKQLTKIKREQQRRIKNKLKILLFISSYEISNQINVNQKTAPSSTQLI